MKKIGLLAALAALLCGFLLYSWMNSVESRVVQTQVQTEPVIETAQVVVAAADIAPYTVIKENMLSTKDFPSDYIPETAALGNDEVIGKCADGTIYAGEMILTNGISSLEDSGAPLSHRIPEGKRAMTISVNSITGVAGYITEGDIIDVLAYYETETDVGDDSGETPESKKIFTSFGTSFSADEGVSINLLECIEVLATGTADEAGDEGTYSTLTLALTPEQCSRLTAMQWRSGATLTLALRSHDDFSEGSTYICTLSEALG